MGAVYLGQHPEIRSKVAVKVLHEKYVANTELVRRFLNEARAVNEVDHPGLVRIHDCGELEGVGAYLVMEYLDGRTLRDLLMKEQPLSLDQCRCLLVQLASVLDAVHGRGIVHRDLKPENVMLVDDPAVEGGQRIKVLDFGIAKLRRSMLAEQVQTQTGMLIGTPQYMSPEQCLDSKNVDQRSDIYSMGCIAYEMVCGRSPYVATTLYELAEQHKSAPPTPSELNRAVPVRLNQVLLRALAYNREDRFSSITAMSHAFCAAMDSGAGSDRRIDTGAVAATDQIMKSVSSAWPRRFLLSAAVLIIVIALSVSAHLALQGPVKETTAPAPTSEGRHPASRTAHTALGGRAQAAPREPVHRAAPSTAAPAPVSVDSGTEVVTSGKPGRAKKTLRTHRPRKKAAKLSRKERPTSGARDELEAAAKKARPAARSPRRTPQGLGDTEPLFRKLSPPASKGDAP